MDELIDGLSGCINGKTGGLDWWIAIRRWMDRDVDKRVYRWMD